MFKTFLVSGLMGLALYGVAQVRGWSMFPSEAEEFQRRRAAAVQDIHNRSSGGSRSGSGGFSGK